MDTLPVGPRGTGFRSSRMVAMGPPKGAAATLWAHRDIDVSFTPLHFEPLHVFLLYNHHHTRHHRDDLMMQL